MSQFRSHFAVLVCLTAGFGFAQAQEVSNLDGLPTAAIQFNSPDEVNGFSVSGIWFPKSINGFAGLTGPAIIFFRDGKSNAISPIGVNTLSVIDDEFWKTIGIEHIYQFSDDPDKAIKALSEHQPISIPLKKEDRASVEQCQGSKDQCLVIGDALVDFQDVDFDGKPELIVNHRGAGQRFGAAYEVHQFELQDGVMSIDRFNDEGNRDPLHRLDDFSQINISKRTIALMNSGGACASSLETYTKTTEGDSAFKLTGYTTWDWDDSSGTCYEVEYAVRDVGGISAPIKIKSRRKAE
jgi:hypothetical protein